MIPVQLDFGRPHYRYRWVSWALLVLCVLAVGWSLARYMDLASSTRELQRNLGKEQTELRKTMPAPKSQEAEQADLARSVDIARRLRLPWQDLFVSLEGAAVENVSLLQVMPDPGKRQLRLSGEAKSLTDVLAYVRRLQNARALSHVHLSSQVVQQTPAGTVVRFVVLADWIQS